MAFELPSGVSVTWFGHATFAGDTSVFGDMSLIAEPYQPTLAFLPIGDNYKMGPHEAFRSALVMSGATTEVITMTPGQTLGN